MRQRPATPTSPFGVSIVSSVRTGFHPGVCQVTSNQQHTVGVSAVRNILGNALFQEFPRSQDTIPGMSSNPDPSGTSQVCVVRIFVGLGVSGKVPELSFEESAGFFLPGNIVGGGSWKILVGSFIPGKSCVWRGFKAGSSQLEGARRTAENGGLFKYKARRGSNC